MANPNTPILVGVGECTERLDDADYRARSPVQLAAEAGRRALADALSVETLASHIDAIGAVRTVEDSSPRMPSPFGKPNCFPRSIVRDMGIAPEIAIWEVAGGQSPQHLVNEFCEKIATGKIAMGLLAGAEAISTARHLVSNNQKADWSEIVEGSVEDRGPAITGISTRYMTQHQIIGAPMGYALMENARRARLGLSQEAYRLEMGKLFAPFTQIAAKNPHAMSKAVYTARELAEINDDNRVIADPYLRRMVSRDQVNQGAALLLTSVGKARELDIDESKWIYLHGYADLTEQSVPDRADLSKSPASALAAEKALEFAGITAADLDYIDLYSCFPAPVFNICDTLGIAPDDSRGLTVTGGLPFFGGAGNNYSMHAICAMAPLLRGKPDSYGFIGANGGMMSKYSAGVYSTRPTEFRICDSKPLQQQIDNLPKPKIAFRADGEAVIETYTINYQKGHPAFAVVVGRIKGSDERFLANPHEKDSETLQKMLSADPIGQTIYVTNAPTGNRFAFQKSTLEAFFPAKEPVLRDNYEFIKVVRDGRLLEVVINRPEARNCLHPPSHLELDEIFNAFYADSELWVCIITGAGTDAFCTGNDLKYSASGKPVYVPRSGFAGLTSRAGRNKPIIAAVNGYAMGGGLEICLACDIVVADEKAQLALSEVKVGLIAGAGGLVRLPRQIPEKVATEMILTGRRIGPVEGQRLGLVSRIAPAGRALEVAREVAADILDGSPTSVKVSMEIMNEAATIPDVVEAVTHYYPQSEYLLGSDDMTEGVTAFAQKRKPLWKNR